MRHISLVTALGALTLLAGCNSTKWNMFRGSGGRGDYQATARVPTSEELVYWLNDNASRVDSVQCASLNLQCSQGLKIIGLDGQMVCQKPRNFRMSASLRLSGTQQLDMGSNNQEFWFWVAQGDPYQFHCSHQALAEGQARVMPLPIHPEWIMEVMGIGKCGPAANYQVVPRKDTVELVEKTRSPQGKPIRKVTVFRLAKAPNGAPQVLSRMLIDDATGKEIVTATITQVRLDPKSQAVLPRQVVFWMPQGRIKLKLTLDEVTVNGKVGRPEVLFARRPINGIKSYDMALGRPDGASPIRQVEGRSR